eukprot:Phypoly_transcript_00758.p1 GENE.Phypoly_transcript_00758~~Phypoly_transcript_00758.p1  ORF type:complete len:1267 (+),score=133.81 Phypoly_transcript_00758:402-3803(+)
MTSNYDYNTSIYYKIPVVYDIGNHSAFSDGSYSNSPEYSSSVDYDSGIFFDSDLQVRDTESEGSGGSDDVIDDVSDGVRDGSFWALEVKVRNTESDGDDGSGGSDEVGDDTSDEGGSFDSSSYYGYSESSDWFLYEETDKFLVERLLKAFWNGTSIVASILSPPTPTAHVAALADVYEQANNAKKLLNWNFSTDPCRTAWERITCDIETNEIVGINMAEVEFTDLPVSLLQISTMERLVFNRNGLDGTIPLWICEFECLTTLDLSFNHYNGTIPECLGNLPELANLDLQQNSLSGTIPESLFRLSNLHLLDLARNNLSGTISPVINQTYWLQYFYVGYNHLYGEFPQFKKPHYFKELDLSNNNFTGTLPPHLVHSYRLDVLDLSNNNFSGAIPQFFKNHALTFLSISGNNFSGALNFSILPNTLTYLFAANNSFSSIIHFKSVQAGALKTLDISHNAISMSYNDLLSSFPSMSPLQNLDISYNRFFSDSQHIILDMEFFPALVSVHLQNNSFSGELHPIINNRHLTSIDISGNNITGDIGIEFSQVTELTELKVFGNHFQHSRDGKSVIPSYMYADYNVGTLYPDYNFSCPQIRFLGSDAIVYTEPGYHGWELCKCFSGYRRVNTKIHNLPFNFTCTQCGLGLFCPGQLNDTQFVINQFYWATPNISSPQFLLPCVTCNPLGNINFSCEANYEGRLCSKCVNGYYKSNSLCHKCEPFGRVAIVFSIVVLILLIIVVTKGNTLKQLFMKDYALQTNESGSLPQEGRKKKREHAQAALSILITYHQTISALSEYFTLPVSVAALVATMRVASFGAGSGLGFQCFNDELAQYKFYYLAIMLEPAAVVVAVLVLYLLGKPFQICKMSFFEEWGIFCTKIGLYALNILYFPVVSSASNAFRCERDPGDGLEYNSAYPYALCDDVPLGVRAAALVLYGGGIMGIFFILVVIYMRNPNPNGLIFKCANFFFDTFQDKYTFFSVLILIRRLVISLIISLLPVNSSLSFGLNALVLTISHLVIMYTKPYKSKTDNDLEIVLGALLLFAYGLALVISQQNLQYGAVPVEVLYFITNLGVVVWCLYELCRRFFALPIITKFHRKLMGARGWCLACCAAKKQEEKLDVEIGDKKLYHWTTERTKF